MSAEKGKTGVVFCSCGNRIFNVEELKSIQTRLRFASGESLFVTSEKLCTALHTRDGKSSLKQTLANKSISKLVFAGCTAKKGIDTGSLIGGVCGIAPSNVISVTIPAEVSTQATEDDSPFGMKEERIRAVVNQINKSIRVLEEMEVIRIKNLPLNQGVLIVGGGIAGQAAAETLTTQGYDPLVVDREGEPASVLTALKGQVGSFTALIQSGKDVRQVDCGAVILATGYALEQEAWEAVNRRFSSSHLVSLADLPEAAAGLTRVPTVRTAAILLDLDADEGKASTEQACRTALELQNQDSFQVYLFCREVRVGSLLLEQLYDDAREKGVVIVKYEDGITMCGSNGTIQLSCIDALLGSSMTLTCDLVGVSLYGVSTAGARDLSEITGVDLDSLGRLQGNNIHLFATGTNVPGVFVAGGCRGNLFRDEAVMEGIAAAGQVHQLLSRKKLQVELSEAKVDADKCALCLTCIRACPHNAMKINREESVAVSVPEVCKRCGICAGECPAKAITLPAYTDDILTAQLG